MKAKLLFFFIGLFFLVCGHHIMSAKEQKSKNVEAKVKTLSLQQDSSSINKN